MALGKTIGAVALAIMLMTAPALAQQACGPDEESVAKVVAQVKELKIPALQIKGKNAQEFFAALEATIGTAPEEYHGADNYLVTFPPKTNMAVIGFARGDCIFNVVMMKEEDFVKLPGLGI